jgi:hypothetical protein
MTSMPPTDKTELAGLLTGAIKAHQRPDITGLIMSTKDMIGAVPEGRLLSLDEASHSSTASLSSNSGTLLPTTILGIVPATALQSVQATKTVMSSVTSATMTGLAFSTVQALQKEQLSVTVNEGSALLAASALDSPSASKVVSPTLVSPSELLSQLSPKTPPATVNSPVIGRLSTLGGLYSIQRSSANGKQSMVHIKTASTNTTQIQQLLTGLGRSTAAAAATSSVRTTKPASATVTNTTRSVFGAFSAASLAVGKSTQAGTKPKTKLLSASSLASALSAEQERVQAIQKMQFHDFPLTTASLSRSGTTIGVTQAKILSKQMEFGKVAITQESKTNTPSSFVPVTVPSTIVTFTTLPTKTCASAPISGTSASSSTVQTFSIISSGTAKSSGTPLRASPIDTLDGPATTTTPQPTEASSVSEPSAAATDEASVEKVAIISAENLGIVTSLIKSATAATIPQSSASTTVSDSPPSDVHVLQLSNVPKLVTTATSKSLSSLVTTSYTTTNKPVLPTISSTRTRKIRTPKQIDM